MNDSRDRMIAALKETVVPMLRDMGFSGSFPHFRRVREKQIDLLTFQFNRYIATEARSLSRSHSAHPTAS